MDQRQRQQDRPRHHRKAPEETLAAADAELRALGARARELEDGVDAVLEKLLSAD